MDLLSFSKRMQEALLHLPFSPVDCEVTSWLNLTVRATDSGNPPRSSYADLSVRVLDENDNAPVFARDEIHLEVAEDAPVGAVVARVEAHDADRDREFGKVREEGGKVLLPKEGAKGVGFLPWW